jgi:hypothetical protein
MKIDITQVDVWAATIKDRPGGLAQKLDALAKAGANLEFLISRRTPEKPGEGVVFVTPIKGAKQVTAAKKAGFKKAQSLKSVLSRLLMQESTFAACQEQRSASERCSILLLTLLPTLAGPCGC